MLIDDRGDQLWLSGVACGDEYERTEGALTVLQAAGFVPPPVEHPRRPLAGYDEMHFREGRLVAARPTGEAVPMSPSGRTAVINGRLVNRLDFDGDTTTPADIWALWLLATEADGWLGHPVSLVLYDSRATSELAHHTGCQLIATGSTGRELWLVLPEADQYDSLSPFPRRHYQGSYVEYSQVVSDIFRYVGADIVPPDRRPRWRRLLGQYDAPPSVIRWPGGTRRAPGVWRPAKRTAPGSG
ncbi:MAG: hypothetical protein ABIR83_11190 [Nakamurella sp.]